MFEMIIKIFKIVYVDLSRQSPLLVANSNYLCIRHACCVMASLFWVIFVRSVHANSHQKKINVNKYLVKFCAYKSINLDPQGS